MLRSIIVMSRTRTTFSVRAVLLGLGLLCLGVFNDQSFARSNPHPTARLRPMRSNDVMPLVLHRPFEGWDVSVAAEAGETNSARPHRPDLNGARVFSAASARWQGLLRCLSF